MRLDDAPISSCVRVLSENSYLYKDAVFILGRHALSGTPQASTKYLGVINLNDGNVYTIVSEQERNAEVDIIYM